MSKGSGGSQTQKSEPWEGQAPYLTDIYSQAQNQFRQGPLQFFPDQTFAPVSDTTIAAEQLARQTALPQQQASADALSMGLQSQLAGPAGLANNPYLAGATEAALRPLYSGAQGLLQQARRDATGAGQLGGTRQAILEKGVIGDYLQKAGDVSAGMYNTAYQNALEAQTRALGLAPAAMQSIAQPAATLAGLGASEEVRVQQAIDDARARFEFAQQAPGEALSQYANIAAGSILPGTVTASGGGGGGIGTGSILGGALGGAAGGGALTQLGIGGMTSAGVGTGVAALGGPMGMAAGMLLGSLFD